MREPGPRTRAPRSREAHVGRRGGAWSSLEGCHGPESGGAACDAGEASGAEGGQARSPASWRSKNERVSCGPSGHRPARWTVKETEPLGVTRIVPSQISQRRWLRGEESKPLTSLRPSCGDHCLNATHDGSRAVKTPGGVAS